MIDLEDVSMDFEHPNGERFRALGHVTLTLKPQEFVSILGPSGCGKTTVLKIMAGLLQATGGTVRIDGRVTTQPGPDRAVVFQDFRLLPWADVLTNVAFGLLLRKVPRAEREVAAHREIERVGLSGFEGHYPSELSGGMQQRVGLARALAVEPDILLMDEPFGALDALTRQFLQRDLLRIWEQTRKTVVFVTHSIEEAVLLSDRVVVMDKGPGRIVECVGVELPRPRDDSVRESVDCRELERYLWQMLSKRPTA